MPARRRMRTATRTATIVPMMPSPMVSLRSVGCHARTRPLVSRYDVTPALHLTQVAGCHHIAADRSALAQPPAQQPAQLGRGLPFLGEERVQPIGPPALDLEQLPGQRELPFQRCDGAGLSAGCLGL